MDMYNLIIVGFIAAAAILALWWTFNTIRRIDNQKNYAAVQLTSIAKLWHKAKFVPEDAKERESLYLYRDFLRKFDEDGGQYPIMVKDGKVRCMSRKEYDNLVGQKNIPSVSPLILAMTLILAVGSVCINLFVIEAKNLWLGLGLGAIMPLLQIVLAIFVHRFNREKNNYRDGLFKALKENSVAFLSVTKPFIIVDAYPNKFGKNKKPLYATIGELPEEQIIEVRDFIIRQKEAETKVVMSGVDNEREIARLTEKTTPQPDTINVSDLVAEQEVQAEQVAQFEQVIPAPIENHQPEPKKEVEEKVAPVENEEDDDFLEIDKERVIDSLVADIMDGEVQKLEEKARKERLGEPEEEPEEPVEISKPEEPVEEIQTPAEDDFSLESIGLALDAEIARRSKK